MLKNEPTTYQQKKKVHRPANERGPRYNNFWHTAVSLGMRYQFVTAASGFVLTPPQIEEIAGFLAGSLSLSNEKQRHN